MKLLITILGSMSILLAGPALAAQRNCRVVLKTSLADGTILENPFDRKDSWGRQLVEIRLDALIDFNRRTAKLSIEEKLKLATAEDIRKFYFQLESLARVYEKYDAKFFKALRAEFKTIEDQLGYVDLQKTLKEKAAELKLDDLEKYYASQESAGAKKLISSLESWNDAKIEAIRAKVKKYSDWMDGKKDRKFLVDRIRDELKDLDQDVREFKFDEPDIEKGLHELRRRIRWVVIEVLSLNHVVQYQKEVGLPTSVNRWFQELLAKNPDLLENKYMRIDEVAIDKPVVIPLQMHGIITTMVSKIGKLKDGSEMQIEFTNAMKAMGYSAEKIQTVLTTLNANLKISQVDHEKLSHDYQQKLNDTNFFIEYSKLVKELN